MREYDNNTKKILGGAAWLGFSAIILKIIGLIYKIPMSYLLGDEGMGYFNSAYTVYTFFYIIGSAGIPKAVSIMCAKVSDGEAKSIFSAIFKIYIIIGIVLSALLFIFSGIFSELIGSKNSKMTILAISPTVFFVCASGVLRGYLNGKTKFLPVAISELIGGICKLLLGLIFAIFSIKIGLSLPFVCAFSILGITAGSFFGFIYLLIYYKYESKGIKREYLQKNKIVKQVFKLGLPIALAAALSNLTSLIDLTVIMNGLKKNGYSDTVSAIIYGNYTTLAVPMFSFVSNLLNAIPIASLPVITKCFAERKYTDLKHSFDSSLEISSFVAVPAFFMFLFFPYEILSAVFERGSAVLGSQFLLLLAPGIMFYSLLMCVNTVLEGTGKIKSAVISLIIGAIVKVVLSFILIRIDTFGALGAPVSTSLSYIVSFSISFYIINKEKNVMINIYSSLKKPLIISALSLAPTIMIKRLLINYNSYRLLSFIILIFFGLFYLFFSLFSTIKRKKYGNLSAKCTKNKVSDY